MCGIGGIYSFEGARVDRKRLERTSSRLAHRGPDGDGIFVDEELGFAHRRLAIIDVSPDSAQPMIDPGSGSVIVLNGEIYNFKELREELSRLGDTFRTQGDTEVLLKGMVRFGPDFLEQVDGDFAFALWNRRERKLLMARDRFGVKPLYFVRNGTELLFSSEIKGILAAGHERRICPSVFREHLRYRYAQGRRTIFDGVLTLAPGEWLEVGPKGTKGGKFWTPEPSRFSYASYEEGLERISDAWNRSMTGRLRSDRSLGLLLSSGIDSSFIALTARALTDRKLHGVTYDVPTLSESRESGELAETLGLSHSIVPHRDDHLKHLQSSILALEEPIGDSIILPTYKLFEECSTHMKVALSGEGADEVLGGYAHQQILRKVFALRGRGLQPLLRAAGSAMGGIPSRALSSLVPYPVRFGSELKLKAGSILRENDPARCLDAARALMSEDEADSLLSSEFRSHALRGEGDPTSGEGTAPISDWGRSLMQDLKNWLPNYGLLRIDKLSMAHGVECRVPFLQHEFAEGALAMTIREAAGVASTPKRALRDLLRQSPSARHLAARPKRPFFLPTEKVYGKSLRDSCEHFLSPSMVRKHGVLSEEGVRQIMNRSGQGGFVDHKKLINVLHLQVWLETSFA